MSQLSVWDYLIIGVYLLGVLVLGLVCSGRQKSLREYFLASGQVPWWAVSLSMYATTLSPISFLGLCGWIYQKDSRMVLGGSLLAMFSLPLAACIWVPIWDRLRMLSIYEYLELRYHPGLRTFGAALFPLQMIFWVGNGLVASSLAFQAVTGVPVVYCLIGIVALGTIYTMLGGSRAVIWTDVAQALVFMFAFMVVGLLLLQYFDWQPTTIYNIATSVISDESGYPKTTLFSTEFSLNVEATIWAILLVKITEVFMFGSSQVSIQRLLATGSKRDMYKAVFGLAGVNVIFMILAVVVSWELIAFYELNPEARALIKQPDEVMAHYVVGQVPMLVRGVIMAGLLAAMMSTFDSVLNSISSITISDFYKRYLVRHASEKHYVTSSRVVTLGWGIVVVLFALWQSGHSDAPVLERVGKLNLLLLPAIGSFFILGVFTTRANTSGVLIGALTSVVLALGFSGFPGLMDPWIDPEFLSINWVWLDGLLTVAGVSVGYLASLAFPAPDKDKLKELTLYA